MSEHIHQTIADLKVRRDQLNTAIAALEGLVGLPFESPGGTDVVRPPARPRTQPSADRGLAAGRHVTAVPDTANGERAAKILKHVSAHAPVSGAAIAEALKVSVFTVRNELVMLAGKHLVHVTGTGRGQKWHLGAKGASRPAPAKEAVR